MKVSTRILILLLATVLVVFFAVLYIDRIPDKYLIPIVGVTAIIVTLASLLVSTSQWEKGRLETEILKEQFSLIKEFLRYLQENPNSGFELIVKDGSQFIGSNISFSPINFEQVRTIAKQDRFIVMEHPLDIENFQYFNELNCPSIHNPLFPPRLLKSIKKLDTRSYLFPHDYGAEWVLDRFPLDHQFHIYKKKPEHLDQHGVRIPLGEDFIRIRDVVAVYKEFSKELNYWFLSNHVDTQLTALHGS